MPAPAVAVEIAPPAPNRSPELVAALLDACSDAVRRGPCVLARSQRTAAPANEPEAEEEPKIVAVVVWSPRRDRASVEVRLVDDADADTRTRDLEFSYADPQLERWRSVGFAVGMLADAVVSEGRSQNRGRSPRRTRQSGPTTRRPATTAGPDEAARASDSSKDEEASRSAEPLRRIWLDAGAATGPGFDTGNWRLGGFARAAYAAGRPFIQASFAYMVRAEDETGLSAQWITVAVGAGHTVLGSTRSLSLQVRGEVLLENVSVSLSAPSAPADDSGHRWLGGLRVGADGSWEAVPSVGLVLGVDLTAVTGAVNVDVAGTRTATVPALRPCLLGGVRIALP